MKVLRDAFGLLNKVDMHNGALISSSPVLLCSQGFLKLEEFKIRERRDQRLLTEAEACFADVLAQVATLK